MGPKEKDNAGARFEEKIGSLYDPPPSESEDRTEKEDDNEE